MAKTKLTHAEALDMALQIDGVFKHFGENVPSGFSYALSKNGRALKNEARDVQKEKDTKLGEYEKKRIKICEEHAQKDKSGGSVKDPNTGNFLINPILQTTFNNLIAKLKEENKKALEEYEKFLETETELELHLVTRKDFPPMPPGVMNNLLPMVSPLDILK